MNFEKETESGGRSRRTFSERSLLSNVSDANKNGYTYIPYMQKTEYAEKSDSEEDEAIHVDIGDPISNKSIRLSLNEE